jgi:hypothetical protein
VDAARPQVGEWATAMHAATWAVELSGRTRAAAAAQMLLVGAVHGGVLDARVRARCLERAGRCGPGDRRPGPPGAGLGERARAADATALGLS